MNALSMRLVSLVAVALGLVTVAGHGVRGYSTSGQSWPTSDVLYYVNASNRDVGTTAARAAVQAGARAWSEQSDASVQLVYAGSTSSSNIALDGTNNVFFRNDSSGAIASTYRWWNGANELIEFDVVFWDGSNTFHAGSSGCVGSGRYIEDIAAHEFGHGLGIDHSGRSEATMYRRYSACSTAMRSLADDDRAGIESLYPPSGTTSPPTRPASLVAQPNATQPHAVVDLQWVDRSDDEDQFLVERANDGQTFQVVGQTSRNVTTYSDTSVHGEATYWYRVRASNNGGTSNPSNVVSTTTAADPGSDPGGGGLPAAPSNPNPAAGASVPRDIDLAWAPASGATSYDVYFGRRTNPPLYRSGLTSARLTLPRLRGRRTFYWRVVARNGSGSTSSDTWWFETLSARASAVTGGRRR